MASWSFQTKIKNGCMVQRHCSQSRSTTMVVSKFSKWDEFRNKYKEELKDKSELLNQVIDLEKEKEIITLVYTTGNTEHNSAIVLKEILDKLKS